jgi:DNA-binding NarL/FixJ family response regulator
MEVGVVSPYTVLRKALCALLGQEKDVQVAVDVPSALDSYEQIRKAHPQVLLVQATGGGSDIEAVRHLLKLLPHARVLFLVDGPDDTFEIQALKAGTWGCISMTASPETLTKALKTVESGEIWMSHSLATRIVGNMMRRHQDGTDDTTGLTGREWEVLAHVAHGYRNKEIARRLVVSENTIKTHLRTIYQKLQIDNRLGAALYYFHQTTQGGHLPDTRLTASAAGPHPLGHAALQHHGGAEHQSRHVHR